MTQPRLNVLVATPLGKGGNGGIDRLMDSVRVELAANPPADVAVRFAATRGQGSIALAPAVLQLFLMRMLRRPDVLHINLSSHGSTTRKLVVAGWARTLGIPYVLHLHGSRYRQYWDAASPKLDRRIVEMFTKAASVVVLGEVWRAYVTGKAPEANVAIVPNATSRPTLAHVPAGEVRVLFLGRVGKRKGTFDLVEALGQLASKTGWRAIVAGDGETDTVRTRLAELGLAERVEVPGWIGPAGVAELISKADVLVLPSYDENLPMSVIEGMAAGLAVVTTPVGAVEDIITDGETGLLVQPGDVPALANALGRVIEDAALRARLGAAAQAVHRERLDLPPYVARLIQVWKDAAA